ncbi:uncharacterized protein LAESUDRAFT_767125 [Laetiporus sulphureus 93-53]|uniref:Uncharacterized protein n=1 Tax=Laetiporus sulphureus 93-53 TaxID=1314785 RepID=A0A165IDI9_9APHY|nr:uncharacterized protein LAESUDRAFT_767125 [Laetiporus sulphureus 93-53]KZT12933.1 hypothetical protein LAESUDRAFT_767125 [Laetiporus sulphureus 93-53]
MSPDRPICRPTESRVLSLIRSPEKATIDDQDTLQAQAQGACLTIPHVVLEEKTVSSAMAASLATSLLGHVLFLKSQLPFPIVQLARMPAFDTLSSHLGMTFSALFSAMLQRQSENESPSKARSAYLAFVLGPSIGAARAKVVLIVDGLDVKVIGQKDERTSRLDSMATTDSQSPESDDEGISEEDNFDATDDEGRLLSSSFTVPKEATETLHRRLSALSEPATPSPPRTFNPFQAQPRVRTITPFQDHLTIPIQADFREEEQNRKPPGRTPLKVLSSQPALQSQPAIPAKFDTLTEEQKKIRAAEHLLSRTLANTCVEGDGGMSRELAPTHAYVLLRVPRRFVHPTWVPRQNLTRSLEVMLQTFLEEASCVEGSHEDKRAKARKGMKAKGIWISCRGGEVNPDIKLNVRENQDEEDEDDDKDEMIWWAWDGKIIGFTD